MTPTPEFSAGKPAASATSIFTFGNQRDEVERLRFCNYFTLLAELDSYPHRAEFVSAFCADGSEANRRMEATRLAESGCISAVDVADAFYWAKDPDSKWCLTAAELEIH